MLKKFKLLLIVSQEVQVELAEKLDAFLFSQQKLLVKSFPSIGSPLQLSWL